MNKLLLEDPEARYFSRELSWLAFNERVLDEAADPANPLLERVKFVAIVSSNLEEFFMVRVAALVNMQKESIERGVAPVNRDGMTLPRLLERIRQWVLSQKTRQARIFEEVCRELRTHGLIVEDGPSELAEQVLEDKVLPFLVPLRIPEGSPLPQIHGSKLYLLARHPKSHSLIELPATLPRVFIVKTKHVFLVDRLLSIYKDRVFKNQEAQEIFSFKISRDAEITLDDEWDDPLQDMEAQIKSRDFGSIVRLEVDSLKFSESVQWLIRQLKAPPESVYQLALPLDLKAMLTLHSVKSFKKLKYAYAEPKRPPALPAQVSPAKFFKHLEKHDILLHHPYVSFDPVVELVRHASTDPAVKRICLTMYRTSGTSPILEAVMQAAAAGKRVTALVEIKARFDEANNIRWARALEKAGVKVIYGSPDIKIHAKLTYVERHVGKAVKQYVHVSTGNYHPRTARLYTDLGMITTGAAFGSDARQLFDAMEHMDETDEYSLAGFKTWFVAPDNLHEQVIKWIENECRMASQGKPAGIRAKMNGLVDEGVIEALYKASRCGVKVDLIVRGMCKLRPGVKGLSENIRVRSIVDKYLEHSRLFIFENGGDRKVWISSADWMPRNFFRRIELAVPVLNPKIIEYLSTTVWPMYDGDNVRSRECDPVGVYHMVPAHGQAPFRSQFVFEELPVPEFDNSLKPS